MSRLSWTDPAPLEVQRPRLPWWTLLPHRLLWAVSPIIAVAVVVTILVFTARRVWQYPLFLIGATILAGLGMGYTWWAPVWLAAGLGAASALWAWAHPDSFDRIAARQVRSEWRRALIYAWPWKRVMLFSELTKHTGHRQRRTHYPTLRRVRSDGWRDRVSVRLVHGQCAATYATHAAELANSFSARSCRVRVDRPPLDPRADNREWAELLKEAGVREARLHDARHTAATVLQVLNVGTRAVMDLMGWSSSLMAARYQHVTNDLRHDIADSLGTLVWGATGMEQDN